MADAPEIMRAIQIVGEYLTKEFIVEECADNPPVMGCASCQAIDLRAKLAALSREIMDDAHHHHPISGDPSDLTDKATAWDAVIAARKGEA